MSEQQTVDQLRARRDMPSYIDDAMYVGASVPEDMPRRCRRHAPPVTQLLLGGGSELVCPKCWYPL